VDTTISINNGTSTTTNSSSGSVTVKPVVTNKTAPIVAPIYTTTTVNEIQTEVDDSKGGSSIITIAVVSSILGAIIIGVVVLYFVFKKFGKRLPKIYENKVKK